MRGFTEYIQYMTEDVQTTGHLTHLSDLVLSGNHESAFAHVDATTKRFNNSVTKGHDLSLKADGGMSVIVGRDRAGDHFVSYKSGKERHYRHDSIAKTGKQHMIDTLSPLLSGASKMKSLKPGTAFQADVLHTPEHSDSTHTPNTISYKTSHPGKLSIAVHGQFAVAGDSITRTSNVPDLSQLKGEGVHTPNLHVHKKMNLSLSDDRHHDINQHMRDARRSMGSEGTAEFAQSLPQNKKFSAMMQAYSNHSARTDGKVSVDGLRTFMKGHVEKRKVSGGLKAKELDSHTSLINDNENHFTNMLSAHNSLTSVTNEVTNALRNNASNFSLTPKANKHYSEHEGLVSSLEGHTPVKFVRRGEQGFSRANKASGEERFGSTP